MIFDIIRFKLSCLATIMWAGNGSGLETLALPIFYSMTAMSEQGILVVIAPVGW
jgi:hypothetical protein